MWSKLAVEPPNLNGLTWPEGIAFRHHLFEAEEEIRCILRNDSFA
jgi:hypothetical protein